MSVSTWTKIDPDNDQTWPLRGQLVIISTKSQPTVQGRNDNLKRGCWFGYQFIPYEFSSGQLYWRELISDIDIIQ